MAATIRGAGFLAALVTIGANVSSVSAELPATITPEFLATAGNNSLFTRWRPRSHFLAPHGWINDPCGAIYDAKTETYHLHYQWHPSHVDWGNISWGHAVSKDLFHWADAGDWRGDGSVSLPPGGSGPLSQFTGTTQPVNTKGENDGTLLTLDTGIHHLPTNWKKPYIPGTEVVAALTSSDGGYTWKDLGIVISGPPEGWNVTGWRDPNFFPSPELDTVLKTSEPHYYMVVGSGLKSADVPAALPGAERPGFIGSRVPLYSAPASNLTQWTFLGALWEPTANASLGAPDVTGGWGYNFEVSSLFDLPAGGEEKAWFVTMGTEGGNTTSHWREQWSLWNRGEIKRRDNGSLEFEPGSGGAMDWGISYAHATWKDTSPSGSGRRVVWAWANEDYADGSLFGTARQVGYSGAFNLPTELFVKETKGVTNCGAKDGGKDGNHCVSEGEGGAKTAQTLGIRPLPEVVEKLRAGAQQYDFDVGDFSGGIKTVASDLGSSYELNATLTGSSGGAVGIIVAQSPDDGERTRIVFDASASQIRVERDRSSLLPNFNNQTFVGHFEPYTLGSDNKVEEINFHVVLDGSLLEVWVNERFALTARIYPSRADSTGLSFFTADNARASWRDVRVWRGLAQAWPDRPEDSSVPLVWDSAEQTGNYTWWTGF